MEKLINVKGMQRGRKFVIGTFDNTETGREEAEACASNSPEYDDITIIDAITGEVLFEDGEWNTPVGE